MDIGFGNGIPANINETWKKERDERTYTFIKLRKAERHFIYTCTRSIEAGTVTQDLSTGFETDRDLTRDEVELRQQFVDFMEGLT